MDHRWARRYAAARAQQGDRVRLIGVLMGEENNPSAKTQGSLVVPFRPGKNGGRHGGAKRSNPQSN